MNIKQRDSRDGRITILIKKDDLKEFKRIAKKKQSFRLFFRYAGFN